MLDSWFDLTNKQRVAVYERKKAMLEEETQNMNAMVDEGKHWEAFNRLNLLLLLCSHELENGEARDGTKNTPYIMKALLEWVSNSKELIDTIIQGIGGEGYGISTSIYGMNLSVSFSSGNNSNINSNMGVSSIQPIGKSESGGMNRALRPRVRVPSPNANRSSVKNPNNPAFRAAANNRSNQMNRNNPAYRSSRSGSKGKK